MSTNLPIAAITQQLLERSMNPGVAAMPLSRDIFLLETHVAGIHYYAAEAAWPGLDAGMPLRLRREPANPHDELAIEICTMRNEKLGYVPRHRNPVLARLMDAGKQLLAEVAVILHGAEAYGGYNLEIRLRISLRDY